MGLLHSKTKNLDARCEYFIWGLCLVGLAYVLRGLLFAKEFTLVHDNLYWNYPIFHFFAVQLMQGHLPLWDPYSYGGQPFYPLLVQFRLLDPFAILTPLIGQFFTRDTAILFHWLRVVQSLWMVLGSYLLLRSFTSFLWVKLWLIPTLLFSSFFLCSFHQDGFLSQFVWIPWIWFFLDQIFFREKRNWQNYSFLALAIGINWQSYFFVGPVLFVFFFLLTLLLFYRPSLKVWWSEKGTRAKTAWVLALVTLMALPDIFLFLEKDRFAFILRMVPQDFKVSFLERRSVMPREADPSWKEMGIGMSYESVVYTGNFLTPWEFLQMITPDANLNIQGLMSQYCFGLPSEAYIYLGLLGWFLGWLGIFRGKSPHKKLFGFLTLTFFFLSLGSPGGLHRLLYPVLPPLWFLRHTTQLVLFIVFGYLYFTILGFNSLLEKGFKLKLNSKNVLVTLLSMVALTACFYRTSRFVYPAFRSTETNLLIVWILAMAGILWITRKLSPEWRTLQVCGSFLACILILRPAPLWVTLLHFSLIFGPVLLAALWQKPKWIPIALFLCSILDLSYGVWLSARLYAFQPHPENTLGVSMTPRTASEPEPRQVYATYPSLFFGNQAPRYLSLLYQKPYAVSPPIIYREEYRWVRPMTFKHALFYPRWNGYFFSRSYFKMINSPFSEDEFEEAFRIQKSPLEWLGAQATRHEIESYEPSKMELTVTLPEASKLYWADGYDRWWQAWVDEKSVPIHLAKQHFKEIEIVQGTHSIRFEYRPWPFLVAVSVFYAVIGGIVLGAAAVRLRGSSAIRAKRNRYSHSRTPSFEF